MPERRIAVLFVCLGNICRSPLAESVFRSKVSERGLEEHFSIDSAGTSAYHVGESPDPRTVQTALARGVEVGGRSRQFTSDDLDRFDYVIAMDDDNFEGISVLARESGNRSARLHLLREWDDEGSGSGVPDPYYGGPTGFDDVQDIVERSCSRLLDHLVSEAGLE